MKEGFVMEEKDTKLGIGIKLFLMVPIVLMVVVLCLIVFTSKYAENNIYLTESELVIDYKGFLNAIPLDEISSIELLDSMPQGGKWGAGIEDNTYVAGDAKLDGIGKCKMYAIKNKDAYLLIHTDEETYFVNDDEDNTTKEIYEKISEKL